MSTVLVGFKGQNWTITPVAPGPNQPAPRNFFEQKWLLVLTGVVTTDEQTEHEDIVGIHGNNPNDWRRRGVRIGPGGAMDAMFVMMNQYGIPNPHNAGLYSVSNSGHHLLPSVRSWT